MALSKLTKDMAVIQMLDDEPNDVGGLTAAQLKAKFDEGGAAVKEFINGSLIPEIEALLDALSAYKADRTELQDVTLGQIPDGTVTEEKLDSALTAKLDSLLGRARCETGSYAGTGTYGADHPCSLTFGFVPKALFIVGQGSGSTHIPTSYPSFNTYYAATHWISGMRNFLTVNANSEYLTHNAVSGNTITWYCTASALYQLNSADCTYYYAAFG